MARDPERNLKTWVPPWMRKDDMPRLTTEVENRVHAIVKQLGKSQAYADAKERCRSAIDHDLSFATWHRLRSVIWPKIADEEPVDVEPEAPEPPPAGQLVPVAMPLEWDIESLIGMVEDVKALAERCGGMPNLRRLIAVLG